MGLQQPAGSVGNAYGYVAATVVIIGHHGTNVMTSVNMNHWAPLFNLTPTPRTFCVTAVITHAERGNREALWMITHSTWQL